MPDYRNFFIGKARMLTKKGKSERIWGQGKFNENRNIRLPLYCGFHMDRMFIWEASV